MLALEQELWYLHPPGFDGWIGRLDSRPYLYQCWNPCLEWQREEEESSVWTEDMTTRERPWQGAAPLKVSMVHETDFHRQVESEGKPKGKAN